MLRSKAWFESQFERFAHGNHGCSLTQLFVINAHQIQIVWAATLLVFALNAVSWPLIIVAARTAQRSAGMIGST